MEHVEKMQNNPFSGVLADRKAAAMAALNQVAEPEVQPEVQETAPVAAPAPAEVSTKVDTTPVETFAQYEDPQFKALLAKSREQRQKLEQLEAEREYVAQQKKTIERAERIQKGDYSAVEELGGSFDTWAAKEFEKASKTGPVEEVPEYVRRLEAKLEAMERQAAEKEAHMADMQRKSQVETWRNQIFGEIDSSPELKQLSVAGLHDKVYERIIQHAAHTQELTGRPEILDTKKAARAVWEAEKASLYKKLEAFRELEDFKPLFSGPAKPVSRPAEMRTLMPGDMGDSPLTTQRKLTMEEKKAAARKYLGG